MENSSLSASQHSSRASASKVRIVKDVNDNDFSYKFEERFLFPFFAEVTQANYIPYLLSTFLACYRMIQNMATCLLLGFSRFHPKLPKFLDVVYSFNDWHVGRVSFDKCIIQCIIILVIFALFWIIVFYLYTYFQIHHAFPKQMILLFNTFILFIIPCVIDPLAAICTKCFCEIIDRPSSKSIVLFCFTLFASINLTLSYHFAYSFYFNSASLVHSKNGLWNPDFELMIFYYCAVLTVCGPLSSYFPTWMTYLIITIGIICAFYQFYQLYFFPFFHLNMNIAYALIYIGCLLCYLLGVLYYFFSIPTFILLSIPLISWIFFFYPTKVFLTKRCEKCAYYLSYEAIQQDKTQMITDAMKRAYFNDFVFHSVKEVEMYLHIGIMKQCDALIDFSFCRSLLEYYMDKDILLLVLKVAVLFPCEQQFFNYCLNMANKLNEITMTERFFLFQAKKVHVFRESSVSPEASRMLATLQKMSYRTIYTVRSFWTESIGSKGNLSGSSLIEIFKLTKQTDALFLNAIAQFPNSVGIFDEYVNFLVEGAGNYRQAIIWKRKSNILQQGKQLLIDFAFHSLIFTYNEYITEHIFTITGSRANQNESFTDSQNDASSNYYTDQGSTSDLLFSDIFDKEEANADFINHGKLRVLIRSILENWHPKSLYKFQFLLIFSFFVFLIILLCCALIFYNPPPLISTCIQGIYHASSLIAHIQYSGLICGIMSLQHDGLYGGFNEMKEDLKLLKDDYLTESKYNFFNQPLLRLQEEIDKAIIDFNSIFGTFQQYQNINSTNSTIYYDLFGESQLNFSFDGWYNQLSFREAIHSYLSLSRQMITICTSDPSQLSNHSNTFLQRQFSNSYFTKDQISYILQKIEEIGINECDSQKKISFLYVILLTILPTLLFFFELYNIIRTAIIDFKMITGFIKAIDQQTIEKSNEPIMKNSKFKTFRNSSVVLDNKSFNFAIGIIISFLLSVVLYILSLIEIYVVKVRQIDIGNRLIPSQSYVGIELYCILDLIHRIISPRIPNVMSSNDPDFNQYIQQSFALKAIIENISQTVIMKDYVLYPYLFKSNELVLETLPSNFSNYAATLKSFMLNQRLSILSQYFYRARYLYSPATNLSDKTFSEILFLVDTHLYDDMKTFQLQIFYAAKNYLEEKSKTIVNISLLAIFLLFLITLFGEYFYHLFSIFYDGLIQETSLLPPTDLVKLRAFFSCFFYHSDNSSYSFSLPSVILNESVFSTLSVKADDMTIQYVNTSFQNMTGFMPDQILGRPLSWLIPYPSVLQTSDTNINAKKSREHISSQPSRNGGIKLSTTQIGKFIPKPNDITNGSTKTFSSPHIQTLSDGNPQNVTPEKAFGKSGSFNININKSVIPAPSFTSSRLETEETRFIKEDFYQKVQDMITNPEKNPVQVDAYIVLDSGNELLTKATVVCSRKANGEPDLLTILLSNQEEQKKQENEAIQLKKQLEDIYNQMIPKCFPQAPKLSQLIIQATNKERDTHRKPPSIHLSHHFGTAISKLMTIGIGNSTSNKSSRNSSAKASILKIVPPEKTLNDKTASTFSIEPKKTPNSPFEQNSPNLSSPSKRKHTRLGASNRTATEISFQPKSNEQSKASIHPPINYEGFINETYNFFNEVFSKNEALIIEIQISQINDFLTALSPKEFFSELCRINNTIDIILSEFPSIIPIKTGGSNFVATINLFDENSDFINDNTIEMAILFCMDVRHHMKTAEDQVILYETKYSISISSVIAGNLVPSVPLFDVFGKAVNDNDKILENGLPDKVYLNGFAHEKIKNHPDYVFTECSTPEIEIWDVEQAEGSIVSQNE